MSIIYAYLLTFLVLLQLNDVSTLFRDHLLEMKNSPDGFSQEALAQYLTNLPRDLQPEDVVDFVSIAVHYLRSTPNTFRRVSLKLY